MITVEIGRNLSMLIAVKQIAVIIVALLTFVAVLFELWRNK